jgi:predicted peroxiredoxin
MTVGGRYRLHGDCVVCGIRKNTFTGKDWVIKKKSKKEKEDAVAKKKAAAFSRQCKELGLEIFQSDNACQQCVAKCLDE